MRDITHKINTARYAVARCTVKASRSLVERLKSGDLPKGDPLPVARVAGIQAAKATSQIIPYCHPIPIQHVAIDFETREDSIEVEATVKAVYKTGVEMEALTAVSVAALTIYDMLKPLDEEMEIQAIRLVEKRGGKTDLIPREGEPLTAAVLTVSDSVASGLRQDESGRIIVERLETYGVKVVDFRSVSDDVDQIETSIKEFADIDHVDMVVTTGGTGLGPRDNTPDVTDRVLDRSIAGIIEAARAYGQERMPLSMLSRARAGMRGNTLIINMPGSKSATKEYLDALFPSVLHVFPILRGGGHSDASKTEVKLHHGH